MVKKELLRRAAAVLRENGVKKPVSMPKQVFHISDDEGNKKDFVVRKTDKNLPYNAEDMEAMFDACVYVIQEALKAGEEVSIRGFGTFGLRYRSPRTAINVSDGEPIVIDGHFVPRFLFGTDLKRCAQFYEQSLADKGTDVRSDYEEKDE